MLIEIETKEQAFAPRPEEVRIPIDFSVHNFRFSRRWFIFRNLTTASTYLFPRFDGSFPVNILEIGCWECCETVWLLQNCARHPDSRIVGIDPWTQEANKKAAPGQMAKVYENAHHNIIPYANKVHLLHGESQKILPEAIKQGHLCDIYVGNFDLIIIDGDHRAEPVYLDAVNSLLLVKVGGWLFFDDVRNRITKRSDHVWHGLRRFLDEFDGRIRRVFSHRYAECFERCN